MVILLHKELPEIMGRLSDRENPPAQSNSYGCWDLQRAQWRGARLAGDVRASCSQMERHKYSMKRILSKHRVAENVAACFSLAEPEPTSAGRRAPVDPGDPLSWPRWGDVRTAAPPPSWAGFNKKRRREQEGADRSRSFENRPLLLAEPTIKVDNWEVKEWDQYNCGLMFNAV